MGEVRHPRNANKAFRYLKKNPELTIEERERLVNLVFNSNDKEYIINFLLKCKPSDEEIQKAIVIITENVYFSLDFLKRCQSLVTEEYHEKCINAIITFCEKEYVKEFISSGDAQIDELTMDLPNYSWISSEVLLNVKLKPEHKQYFLQKLVNSTKFCYFFICSLYIKDPSRNIQNTFTKEEILPILESGLKDNVDSIFELHSLDEIYPEIYDPLFMIVDKNNNYELAYKLHKIGIDIYVPSYLKDKFDSLIIGGKLIRKF